MSRQEEEDDDLDGILDSALAEFDALPSDLTSVSTIHGAPPPAVDDFLLDTSASPIPKPRQAAGHEVQLQADVHEAPAVEPGSEVADDGLDAFEKAIASLNDLKPNGSGDPRENAEPSEAEDMRLVEDFLQSLTSEFEKLGMPRDSPDGQTGGSSGGPNVNDGIDIESSALPVEQEIDKLTRELEALLGGAASKGDSGGSAMPPSRGQTPGAGPSGRSDASARTSPDVEGDDSGGHFENIVESVVGELLSRDVLKGPMEQMRDSYATWLPKNADNLSGVDAERYRTQADIVKRICKEYEREDSKTTSVMTLLQEMQATGAPPPEVMAQLGSEDGSNSAATGASGSAAAAELEKLQNCPVQ